jgi:hypothetical protein
MKWSNFYYYLVAAITVTFIHLLIYGAVQQTYRSGADDPQIQEAEDLNERSSRGVSIETYFRDTVELSRSLGIFTQAYSQAGTLMRSSGFLHGRWRAIPSGVLDFVRAHGQERFSWQPEPGVRMAMVVLRASSAEPGFFAVGRSLREVEKRERHLTEMVFLSWVALVVLLTITAFFLNWIAMRKKRPTSKIAG